MSLTKKDIQCILAIWHGQFDRNDEAQTAQSAETYNNLMSYECSDGGLGYQQPVTLNKTDARSKGFSSLGSFFATSEQGAK